MRHKVGKSKHSGGGTDIPDSQLSVSIKPVSMLPMQQIQQTRFISKSSDVSAVDEGCPVNMYNDLFKLGGVVTISSTSLPSVIEIDQLSTDSEALDDHLELSFANNIELY